MKQQKKNKLYTFIFSLIPGAAEMYMGFMKNGISLMALFFISFMIPMTLRFLSMEAFVLVAVLVWFYSFFHARNLAALPEADFQAVRDAFLWEGILEKKELKISNPALRKWGAGILIVLGVVMLWENFSGMIYNLIPDRYWDELYPIVNRIPQVVIALLIIFIGFKLLAGKKEELDGNEG